MMAREYILFKRMIWLWYHVWASFSPPPLFPLCFRPFVKPKVGEFCFVFSNKLQCFLTNKLCLSGKVFHLKMTILHVCEYISHDYPNSCILMICLGNNCQWIKCRQLISSVNNVLCGSSMWKGTS